MDYQTSDIGLSAYLMMQGFKLISAKKLGNGRFEFTFEDTSSNATTEAMKYINSEFCKFDNHIRNLKKIIYKK